MAYMLVFNSLDSEGYASSPLHNFFYTDLKIIDRGQILLLLKYYFPITLWLLRLRPQAPAPFDFSSVHGFEYVLHCKPNFTDCP